ncbi:TusE/DsrC/DsvC family sulfur relay protein [Fangia hongkongensis]|uniref:TusE/DsrC/DsvC family sulfur relay protein n=1 Tax=Fangia hongkongensis TaxID=270495 RepID=UPI0003707AC4|nr:TusE/DsrC/DsvC family sulfur relay protein [Fangia hongkongensis]MBK2124982.1 TusE/DsrC/DsvC family sulfur relay protein [Fangia hongkongensis]
MHRTLKDITNQDGFLTNYLDWDQTIANEIAKDEAIELTEAHWKIIYFLREYYQKEQKSPAIRILVKSLKEKHGAALGNSLYLQQLFPVSPAVQAAKIAGLPKPKRCI